MRTISDASNNAGEIAEVTGPAGERTCDRCGGTEYGLGWLCDRCAHRLLDLVLALEERVLGVFVREASHA